MRRGFIEAIEFSVDRTPPTQIAHALARTPLCALHLDGRDRDARALDDTYVAALAALPIARLRRLVLYGFDVSTPALGALFEQLPALASVQLSKAQRPVFDVGAFATLRSLRRLDLDDLPLAADALDRLGALPLAATLEHLSIRTFEPVANIVDALDGRFPRLRSLVLAGNRDVDFRRLPTAVTVPARLGLRYAQVSRASLEALVDHGAGLASLDLERVPLGDDGAAILARAPRLAGLGTLNVDGTGIGDPGARALGRCASARLVELDLSNNPISAPGLEAAVTGHALRRLRFFDRSNPADGIAVATVVARLATLRSLALGPLGGAGTRRIVESSALAQLRELQVSDPAPALGRLEFRDLVVLRVFATVPRAIRREVLARALPALVVNE